MADINKDSIFSIKHSSIIQEVDFIEPRKGSRGKVFILNFKLQSLDFDSIYMFCGETREENPFGGLLDRIINVFDLEKIRKWWLSDSKGILNAEVSFKGGKKVKRSSVYKIDEFAPNVIFALNNWWKI